MERKWIIALVVLCLVTILLHFLGIGLYSSSSAVSDLKAELERIAEEKGYKSLTQFINACIDEKIKRIKK